ncbi:hypothetical protein DFJ73DRAFT_630155 [Zopfochytrium polystomum]|nr:hypothetical protein DFJ73DRAFT_630155 [Zopfochytrium polystomum]
MGRPASERIRMMAEAIGSGKPLASLDRMGLPRDMQPYRPFIPSFFHGQRPSTVDKISEKSKSRSLRLVFPNVIANFMYSRLLDLNIYTRMTTEALRRIEKAGGLDEYVLSLDPSLCGNDTARMYQRMIHEAQKSRHREGQQAVVQLASRYGQDYKE